MTRCPARRSRPKPASRCYSLAHSRPRPARDGPREKELQSYAPWMNLVGPPLRQGLCRDPQRCEDYAIPRKRREYEAIRQVVGPRNLTDSSRRLQPREIFLRSSWSSRSEFPDAYRGPTIFQLVLETTAGLSSTPNRTSAPSSIQAASSPVDTFCQMRSGAPSRSISLTATICQFVSG